MKSYLATALIVAGVFSAGSLARSQTAYTSIVSNDAPSLYWNFDEPAGNAQEVMPITLPSTINDLVPVNTATRLSHTTMGSGLNLGNAASFLVGDYFMAQNLAIYTNSIAGPWAIEFWMRPQGSMEFQRNNYLLSFGGAGGNQPAVLYDYQEAAQPRYALELYRQGGGRTGAGPLIPDQNWHHVVLAYYGYGTNGVADRLDMYVDGTNAAPNIRSTFTGPIVLTRFIAGTSAPQFSGLDGFQGELDEIAIYDLATLTTEAAVTTKVSQLASGHYARAHTTESYATAVLADQPVLYWNFDEPNGNALQRAPVVIPPVRNELVPLGPASRISHAGTASGVGLGQAAHIPEGGYFAIPQLVTTNSPFPGPWIIEFWMQPQGNLTTHPRNDYLLNLGNNAPAILYDYVGGATVGGVELFRGQRTGAGPAILDPNWHHLMFVYYGDGATGVADRLDIYMDGTNAAQNVRGTFTSDLAMSSLAFGTSQAQYAAGDGFEGNLDELAIYDLRALQTEAAVTAKAADMAARHYAVAQQPVPPSLEIQRSGSSLVISWSASASGYSLESATAFAPSSWAAFGETPTITDGRAQVTISPTNTARFFRLKK